MSDQNKYSGPVSDGLSPLERVLEQLEIERGAAKIALEIAAQHIRNLLEQLDVSERARKLLIRENDQLGEQSDCQGAENQRLREQLETLREWDTGFCFFEKDGQGPPCPAHWPDDRKLWCSSCVAMQVLGSNPATKTAPAAKVLAHDEPARGGGNQGGSGEPVPAISPEAGSQERDLRSEPISSPASVPASVSEPVKGEGGTRGLVTQEGKPVSDSQPPPVSGSETPAQSPARNPDA